RSAARPGRRHLLRAGSLGAGALGVGAASIGLDRTLGPRTAADGASASAAGGSSLHGGETVPFHGAHQAGIETPAPAAATFIGLDLREEVDREGVLRMLRLLTDDAARLTRGEPALADTEPEMALEPASLTVTVGFGRGLMERAEREAPSWLEPLPAFGIDALEDAWTGGDLMLQVAAEDPLTVSHAVRMLLKDTRAFTRVRWVQPGFRRSPGTVAPGTTMRNLFGQLDGSANAAPGSEHFTRVVGIEEGPIAGGTSTEMRRMRMAHVSGGDRDGEPPDPDGPRRLGRGGPHRPGAVHRHPAGRRRSADRRHGGLRRRLLGRDRERLPRDRGVLPHAAGERDRRRRAPGDLPSAVQLRHRTAAGR